MSSPLASTVDPRLHALRTLAQFLTRHGPVQAAEPDALASCEPTHGDRTSSHGTSPDSPAPHANVLEGDSPCALSA
jgi:hypothetical protein